MLDGFLYGVHLIMLPLLVKKKKKVGWDEYKRPLTYDLCQDLSSHPNETHSLFSTSSKLISSQISHHKKKVLKLSSPFSVLYKKGK